MPKESASPASQLFRMNRFNLSFQGEIESEYRQDHFNNTIRKIRLVLILGILVYGFFGILDAYLFPSAKYSLWSIRFLIVIPYTLVIYILSFHRLFSKYIDLAIASSFLVSGLGITGMIALLPAQEIGAYYVGLVLVFMFYYTVCQLRFIWATITGLLIVVGYEIAALAPGDTPLLMVVTNNFFFLGGNLMGMVACYSIEQMSRMDFVKARLLEIEKGHVDLLNKELEDRVDKRTQQLVSVNEELRHEMVERKEAEERYKDLFEESRDAVFITSVEGDFLDLNPAGIKMFGYESLAEIRAVSIVGDLYQNPTERERYIALMQEQGHVQDFDLIARRKDGKQLLLQETATAVLNSAGKIVSYQGIMRDITEKRELEKQLMQADKMKTIGLLAGGIAHDLNNVLTPIMMAIQILLRKATDTATKTLLNTLRRNTSRGADIVKQVLTFARGTTEEMGVIQPKHLLRDALELVKETFPKSIEVSLDLPKDLWAIEGDPSRLQQVFMNLCINARDAMPDGGTLKLVAKNLSREDVSSQNMEGFSEGPYVQISVEDTGTGMTPSVIENIFEPFFTTKEEDKGTGIGLALVQNIVQDHGGLITVESELGKGTRFNIWLPGSSRQGAAKERTDEQGIRHGSGELILVVDDESAILQIVKEVLVTYGYKVITAPGGTEALGQLAIHRNEVDLLITDMMMPGMDGKATTVALRNIKPGLPVIIASGDIAEHSRIEMEALNVNSILPKPFTAQVLLNTVAKVLDKARN